MARTLNQGYVRSSNVNVVEELVSMGASAYEINSRVVQTSDEMLAACLASRL
jgi:flagellar basal-body rod protein FlgG